MDKFLEVIWLNKLAFVGTFFLVFTLSYIVLLAIDFIPEPPEETEATGKTQAVSADELTLIEEEAELIAEEEDTGLNSDTSLVSAPDFPVLISIDRLGKTIPVLNPSSRTIADLDAALLDGVVRHPDSANLTQQGNVFILGHSSYLPNVFNKNFQAFNGIQDLEWGDIVKVYSEDFVYEYRVEKVYRASAQDATVPIAGEGYRLTLATCNSFGSIDDRYIVETKQINVQKRAS